MSKFRVIKDKILVQRDPEAEAGHVLMTDNIKKKPQSGTVLAVGKGVEDVVVGEHIYFNEYAGYFLDHSASLEESDLIVMEESEVLAIEVVENSDEETE